MLQGLPVGRLHAFSFCSLDSKSLYPRSQILLGILQALLPRPGGDAFCSCQESHDGRQGDPYVCQPLTPGEHYPVFFFDFRQWCSPMAAIAPSQPISAAPI